MSKDNKLTISEVEKLYGKPMNELLQDPEVRKSLAERLSDDAIKECLNVPREVYLSPENVKMAKYWLIEYGRQPTSKEIEERANRNLEAYLASKKEAERVMVSGLAKIIKLEELAKGRSDEQEEKLYVQNRLAELRQKWGNDKEFDGFVGQARRIVREEVGREWLGKTRLYLENVSLTEEKIASLRKRIENESTDEELKQMMVDVETELVNGNAEKRNKIKMDYAKLNPELAALRKKEEEQIKNGEDPKKALKERREAVKAYYNRKKGNSV